MVHAALDGDVLWVYGVLLHWHRHCGAGCRFVLVVVEVGWEMGGMEEKGDVPT